nr:hypothetical protein [Tanacetum cinerariifolium]
MVNPTVYTSCIEQFWATVKAKTVNGEGQLQALVDGKKVIITELTIRRYLQLEDAEGVDYVPNVVIFEQLTLMGVLDLETTKTTQAMEIESLKRRAKKLEKKQRIADIDAIEDIYLVNVHKDKDIFGISDSNGDEVILKYAEMLFDVADNLRGEEVFVSQEVPLKEVSAVDEVQATRTATTTTVTIDDITLAKALMEIKNAKPNTTAASTRPKAKGLVIHDQEEAPTLTISSQQPLQVKDKGK